jgi:hypothetical protein
MNPYNIIDLFEQVFQDMGSSAASSLSELYFIRKQSASGAEG